MIPINFRRGVQEAAMTIPEIKQILRAARAAGLDYNACLGEVYINLEEITPEFANKKR